MDEIKKSRKLGEQKLASYMLPRVEPESEEGKIDGKILKHYILPLDLYKETATAAQLHPYAMVAYWTFKYFRLVGIEGKMIVFHGLKIPDYILDMLDDFESDDLEEAKCGVLKKIEDDLYLPVC